MGKTRSPCCHHSQFFDDSEKEAAGILLELPRLILESDDAVPFSWGGKKPRSALRFGTNTSSSASTAADSTCTSPDTPLLFPPKESEHHPSHSKIRISLRRKADNVSQMRGFVPERKGKEQGLQKLKRGQPSVKLPTVLNHHAPLIMAEESGENPLCGGLGGVVEERPAAGADYGHWAIRRALAAQARRRRIDLLRMRSKNRRA
ncbi:uncharacterized protein LOC131161430 [Malania oleifera]|uniref:uncharacterized protein LOC131161430 n=1 Tax=Malania oleifera TaxID=397392 RepID=UPI0025ADB326|nr:uncharacterized protein LOC131161430 [Malania oleifera]